MRKKEKKRKRKSEGKAHAWTEQRQEKSVVSGEEGREEDGARVWPLGRPHRESTP